MTSNPSRSASRATHTRRRWRVALAVLLLVIGGVLVWKGTRFWQQPLTIGAVVPHPTTTDAKRFTVLILGADDRPDEPGRSDTALLAFVDLNASSLKLLSVPRDSYTEIPGHGRDKFNAAYAFGQEELARQTLEGLIGLPVDYTIAVNMQGFAQIVDAVGGVDIDVDENMDYADPYDTPPLTIHLTKGLHHLNGVDALHYVRFRHDDQSDWGRMKRQQNFLRSLLHAVEQPANLSRLPQLLKLGMANIRTNLSPSQLTDLAMAAKNQMSDQSISGQTLTGDDLWTSEGYYLALHVQELRNTIRQLAGLPSTEETQRQDQSDAAAYQAALPKGASTYAGLLALEAKGAGAPATNAKPPTPATPAPADGKQATPWSLVVVDGSGGKQGSLLSTLKAERYQIIALQKTAAAKETTIVWYNGPEAAARRLQALLPKAKFLHLAPGPGDPPLKLILSAP